MNLPILTAHFDFGNWFYGLMAAFIAGFANAITGVLSVMLVAPDKFNLTNPGPTLQVGLVAGLFGGLIGFFGVLKTTPLPPIVKTHTVSVEKIMEGTGDGGVKITDTTTTSKVVNSKENSDAEKKS